MNPETRPDEDARREFWIFHMERSAELRFSDSKIAGDLDRIFSIRRA